MKRNILAIPNSFRLNVFAVGRFQILKVFAEAKNVLNAHRKFLQQLLWKVWACLARTRLVVRTERKKHASSAALKHSRCLVRAFQLPDMRENVTVYETAAF